MTGDTVSAAPPRVGNIRRMARSIASRELYLLAPAAALILFGGRWARIGLSLLAVAWICRAISLGRLSIASPLDPPIAGLLVMAAVGYAVSPLPMASQPALWRLLLGISLYYGIVNTLTRSRRLAQFTGLVIAGGVVLAFVGLVGTSWAAANVRLLGLPVYDLLPQLALDPTDRNPFNPRVLGTALAMVIPLALAVVLFGETFRARLVAALAIVPMLAMLLLAQPVQALLGLAAATLFLLLVLSPRFAVLIVPLAAAGAWAATRLDLRAIVLTALDTADPRGIGVVLRLDIWSRALAMIRDLPFTGIGLDMFPQVQTNFYIGHLLGPEPHAHNLYLQVALDHGLPGLVLFLWLLLAWSTSLWRSYERTADRGLRALLVGPAAGIVAMAAAGTIDTLWSTKPGVLMWILLGIGTAAALRVPGVAASAESQGSGARLPAEGIRKRGLAWGVLVAALVMAAALAWVVPNADFGLARAHKVLLQVRETGHAPSEALESAAEALRRCATKVPDDADVYRRLGSVLAWQGEDVGALAALRRAVALDSRDPLSYAPFVAWRRRLQSEPVSQGLDDALLIYRSWSTRYPDRAEEAVQLALAWADQGHDYGRAAAELRAALERGAQPASLLRQALARFETSGD